MDLNTLLSKYENMIAQQREMIRLQDEQLVAKTRIIGLQEKIIENLEKANGAMKAALNSLKGTVQ